MNSRATIQACAAYALGATLLAACDRGPAGRGGSSGPVLAAAADSQDVFATVAPFALTERSGRTVLREDLLGRPWVAAFIFTRCSGPCPKVTSTMRRVQARLSASSPARLVSFSVDPEWDTPAVLSEYAQNAGADPQRWLFLTGPEKTVDDLVRTSFLAPVERATDKSVPVGESVSHRTQLVVVDKQGRVRGFYAGETDADVDHILARLAFLEREPAATTPLAAALEEAVISLPLVNACLNASSAVLLCAGLASIKAGRRKLHERLMVAASIASALFLACYLYYHFVVIPEVGVTSFRGAGAWKSAYYAMLASHVVLAVVNLPMVLRTLFLAYRERWDAHKRLAKITFPLWLYVSVTGVLVYYALYVWQPPTV